MNEELLKRIADSLERIAICMENSQARERTQILMDLSNTL